MIIGIVLAVLILIGLLLGYYAEQRIENALDEALGNSAVYDELEVSMFSRQIDLSEVKYEKEGDTISIERLEVKGISYYQYFFNDKISIDEIEITGPDIVFTPSEKSNADKEPKMQREISVSNIVASNGVFRMAKKDSVGDQLYTRFPEFSLGGVKIDSGTVSQKIPFSYEEYRLKLDTLALHMNPEHYISTGDVELGGEVGRISDFRIVPHYTRVEFDRRIPHEKDHVTLQIEDIELDSLSFVFKNDSLHLQSPMLRVSGGDLEIYRNKLLAEDPRIKPLYSKMLREAPVKLNLPTVRVENSRIQYDEQVQAQRQAATVIFTDVSGTIENAVNERLERPDFPRTEIAADALFMDQVPVSLEWSFNVTDPNDRFMISGEFGTVPGEAMNPFLRPAMNLEAEGSLRAVYFTFSGNDDAATGDVRVSYENFRIKVLQDDGREERGLLTALANLFVDNDGISQETTHDIEFAREKNKSFWNYVWTGVQKGVIDLLSQL